MAKYLTDSENALDSSRIIFIIVLDEIDALIKDKGDAFMYELTRINETLSKSKVAIIGISNDLRLKEFLDPRVFSSLSEEELVFRPYDAGELSEYSTGTLKATVPGWCLV